jgi:hypothetical protein
VKKFHIALGVADITACVDDYSERLQAQPAVVVPGEYALWRTAHLNFSVRKVEAAFVGQLRHLGWEDPHAEAFSRSEDCNGVQWEHFNLQQQLEEIALAWPGAVKGFGRV